LKELLTIKEVSALLKINPYHLYRLCGQKQIPHLKIQGVGVRFDPLQIENWIKEGELPVCDWDERIEGLK